MPLSVLNHEFAAAATRTPLSSRSGGGGGIIQVESFSKGTTATSSSVHRVHAIPSSSLMIGEVRQLDSPLSISSPHYEGALRIYNEAFLSSVGSSDDIGLPLDIVKRHFRTGVYRLFVLLNAAQEVIGLAICASLPSTKTCHLDYFAIDHRHRGHGTGSTFFKALVNLLSQEGKYTMFTLECEPRLVPFYTRMGAVETNYDYDFVSAYIGSPSSSTPAGHKMHFLTIHFGAVHVQPHIELLDRVVEELRARIHGIGGAELARHRPVSCR